jgi:CRP-like cAMP-binding protein
MDQPKEIFKGGSEIPYFPFQQLLGESQRKELAASSSLVEYSKRDIIVSQNAKVQHIPIVLSGLVKISREMRKGKSIILRIAQSGSFLGLSSVFSGETFDYSVVALETSLVGYIEIDFFKSLIEQNGPFGYEIIKQMGKDDTFNIRRLSSLLYKQLPGRVADIMLYFSEEIYSSPNFNIPLTRQELAELAGTTKESLIRTLSEFNHDKIINMNRNNFSINSMNIIKTLSRLG